MLNNYYEEISLKSQFLQKKNESINILHKHLLYSKLQIKGLKVVIIIYSIFFFIINFFHLFLKEKITLDNKLVPEYEDNLNFLEYNTTIKPIALYNPKNYLINSTFMDYSLRNNIEMLYIYDINAKKLNEQINLAKNHGIYGFGFYYFWPNEKRVFNSPLDLMVENKQLDFNFLLIWEPDLKYNEKDNDKDRNFKISKFCSDISKYVMDSRYIKFNNERPIIGINNTEIKKKDLITLRQNFRAYNLGEIFILLNANDSYIHYNNITEKSKSDGLLYSTKLEFLDKVKFYYNNTFGYFYTELLYHNLHLNIPNNDTYIYRTTVPLLNYPFYIKENKTYIYGDYTQEKFYLFNHEIIRWTQERYDEDNQYIFIDNFHFFENNSVLGYANINTFSKALYKIPFIDDNKFNLINLKTNALVLVQAHVYYTELLADIVIKSNNFPVPFDLYITTNTKEKKNFIEDYLKKNSLANKYEVLILENKGRDVIPFLTQIKDIWENYKYFCHIHTKKHGYDEQIGYNWQGYLYNNLLGDKDSISKILTDFENNNKLGVIIPDHFYSQIKYSFYLDFRNKKHLYNLFETLFPFLKLKIGNVLDFPVGNMFWARTSAVYQIFDDKIIKKCPEEKGQLDGTMLHAIERIWLYLAKLNGFYYKSNLNHV